MVIDLMGTGVLSAEEERAQANALFDSIGDGAIATDEFGKIKRINPAALAMLGYKEKEVLGKWFPTAIVNVDETGAPLSLIDRPITKAFLLGTTISDRNFFLRKDGTRFPVAVTVSPIIHNDRPIGAIEVFRDISVEMEIDQMKSEFISLASHQLRTPLSAVKTYTHMLMEGYMGDVTPEQKRSLSTIVSAANRMNELISTLLNITRIESGNIAVTPKSVNLIKLCEEAIREVRRSAEEKEIALSFKYTSAASAKTDALIAKEILNNLVSNAIKYTPARGSVTIKLSKRAKEYIISVHDTGFGIPEEARDKIFTKFFRAANVVKRETSGTGLGLYLVKGLAEQLGGTIWFDSEENQGSTFYFSLPN